MSSPCAFNSGHLMASPKRMAVKGNSTMYQTIGLLSSKSSENRFLVNFQMTKARIAINATPPATESPMIVDVPTGLLAPLPLSWSELELGVGVPLDVCEGWTVVTTTTTSPLLSVDDILETMADDREDELGGEVIVEVSDVEVVVEEVVLDVELEAPELEVVEVGKLEEDEGVGEADAVDDDALCPDGALAVLGLNGGKSWRATGLCTSGVLRRS